MSEAKLPPGFVLESLAPDPGGLPPGFVLETPASSPAEPEKPGMLKSFAQGNLGALDAAGTLLTRGVSGAASQAAGVLGMAMPDFSPMPQPHELRSGARDPMREKAERGVRWRDAVQNWLTPMEPQTPTGQAIMKPIDIGLNAIGDFADSTGHTVTDKTGSPYAGALTSEAIKYAPALVLRGMRGRVEGAIENRANLAAQSQTFNETLRRGQAEGFVAPPDSLLGRAAGPSANQEATRLNAPKYDAVARREASLGPNQDINAANLDAAVVRRSGPYDEIRQLSPYARQEMDKLIQAQFDAREMRQYYVRDGNPELNIKAQALEAKVKQIEAVIDNEALRAGRPDLIPKRHEARTAIAKIEDVRSVLNKGSGSIDAQQLGLMLDRGVKLSGGLETIARWSLSSGRAVSRDASKVPIGTAHAISSLGLGGLGLHFGGPAGAAMGAAAGLAVPHAMRSIALSGLGQASARGAVGTGLRLADIGTSPTAVGAAALTPSLGLRPPPEEQ